MTGSQERLRHLTDYGLGLVVVAVIVCVADFTTSIVDNPAGVRLNVACLVVYLAATAACAVRVVRGDRRQVVAWIWVAVTLLATAVLRLHLPAHDLSRSADWSLGAFGYVAIVVMFGQPLILQIAVQTANCWIGLPTLIGAGLLDQARIVQFAATAVAVVIFPIAAAVFYPQLKWVAVSAEHDIALRHELLARESAAKQVADDRAARSSAIEATAAPLLRALADGTADPQNPGVRRAARIESARMRRLFAEVDDADEPMLHEIRASIDAVERLGVTVTLETRGQVPALPLSLRRAMLDSPMSTLASAVTSARVVIVAGPGAVSVSVVTDGPPGPATANGEPSITRTSTTVAEKTWSQTSWEAAS